MTSPTRLVLTAGLLVLVACRSLDLPEPPGAGSIQGLLVYAGPAGAPVPAGGATVELQGTSVATTSDPVTGFFRLAPVPVSQGSLLIRYDADHDGRFDHDRSLALASIGAGPGKATALGTVTLSGNASVRGTVLRADALASASGHGGSNVFVPQGPYLVYTGDNGAYSLDGLPEGEVTLAFFRTGYRSQETTVSLRGGELLSLPTIILTVDENAAVPVQVSGTASLFGQASSAGIEVTATGGATTTTAADGTWTLSLPAGRYVFAFARAGYGTVVLRNLAVAGAEVQLPAVVLTPGTATTPDLDAGVVVPVGGGAGAGGGGGGGAGGGSGAGGGAGSADAGPGALLAVIDPLPTSRPFAAATTLNGTHSTGGSRPYAYHWTQTRGTAVALSANHSTAAGTPGFTTPAAGTGPTVLGFTLSVTDAFDAGSPASAEVLLPVGGAPTAAIAAPPATVFPGQQLVLDGSGSTDPGGTGLTQFLWTASPAGVVTVGPPVGARVTLTMPPTNATPQVVQVSLTVVNGVGISSAPATVQFALATTPAPTWSLDAGPGQTVRDGQLVTLKGLITTPNVTGATFTTRWGPASAADGGLPWLLTDPTALTTTFVAPSVVGPNLLLNFSLTATSTSGLTPAEVTSSTFVNVLDQTAPTVAGLSLTNGRAGLLGTWVDFSEPIDPASAGQVNVNGGQVVERLLTNGGTRLYLLTAPMSDGASYTFTVGSVRDLSPQGNGSTFVTFPFVAQRRVSPTYASADTTPTDPHPGLVLRPGAAPNSVEALIFGRNGNAPWFLQAFDPTACDAGPCLVPTDATAPTATLTPTQVRGTKGLRLGTTAYATLQPTDLVNGAPSATFVRAAGSWAPATTPPPGALFTDGTKLYAAAVQGGLQQLTYDPATDTWGSPQVASADGVLYASDTASTPAPGGAISSLVAGASYTYLGAKVSKANDVRVYQRAPGASTWTAYGPFANTVSHRLLTASANAYLLYSTPAATLSTLNWTIFGGANNAAQLYASGVSGFDAMTRSGSAWYAASVNGLLLVRMITYGNASYTTIVAADGLDGMNNDRSCLADSPEFAQVYEKVGVVWAEQCAGGPWRVYFRLLE